MKICNNSFFKTLKTLLIFAIYNITNNLSFWLKIYSNHWSWSPRMLESKSSNLILNWYWTKLSECQEINSWQLLPTLLKISWLKWKKSVEMPILRLSFKPWARILWMSFNLINLISKTKILFIHLEKVESHLKKINKLIQDKLQKEDKTNMIFQIKNVIFKKP